MLGSAALGVVLLAASPDLAEDAKYASVLSKFVVEGRVDYRALKADRSDLDAYLAKVASVPAEAFSRASADAQVAYLINAYNAYTLASIIDHYPIRGGWLGGANSIKGISGVWDRQTHRTALGEVTLDFIEHGTLRKNYSMPAVHMALVCASVGCPPLRGEPFVADRLPAQLEQQARAYLASPSGLRTGKGNGVRVSMIFKWFSGDFELAGGWKAWVSERVPREKRAAVESALAADTFEWLEYDWSLNDGRVPK